MFNETYKDNADNVLLSYQHAKSNQNAQPQIVINNNFEGLNQLINPNAPAAAPVPIVSALPLAPKPFNPVSVPKMTLDNFCERFEICINILQKLNIMNITGPHALHYITKQDFLDGGLNLGEIADVQDAYEWWMFWAQEQ